MFWQLKNIYLIFFLQQISFQMNTFFNPIFLTRESSRKTFKQLFINQYLYNIYFVLTIRWSFKFFSWSFILKTQSSCLCFPRLNNSNQEFFFILYLLSKEGLEEKPIFRVAFKVYSLAVIQNLVLVVGLVSNWYEYMI